mmetsp:Transcript_45614/g.108553  ORF Transcript_45614/g.108553 Transcript_45614/m.108553 type:complete len:201 (-) Transcript_45614:1972-2574(-)
MLEIVLVCGCDHSSLCKLIHLLRLIMQELRCQHLRLHHAHQLLVAGVEVLLRFLSLPFCLLHELSFFSGAVFLINAQECDNLLHGGLVCMQEGNGTGDALFLVLLEVTLHILKVLHDVEGQNGFRVEHVLSVLVHRCVDANLQSISHGIPISKLPSFVHEGCVCRIAQHLGNSCLLGQNALIKHLPVDGLDHSQKGATQK